MQHSDELSGTNFLNLEITQAWLSRTNLRVVVVRLRPKCSLVWKNPGKDLNGKLIIWFPRSVQTFRQPVISCHKEGFLKAFIGDYRTRDWEWKLPVDVIVRKSLSVIEGPAMKKWSQVSYCLTFFCLEVKLRFMKGFYSILLYNVPIHWWFISIFSWCSM